ncbi:hypothetical protein GCM10027289_01290 [Tsukamurella serpentis]
MPEILERRNLARLGTEDQPEQLVLTTEDVRHRRTAHPPPGTDPGAVPDALREGVEDGSDAIDPLVGNVRSTGHP